VADLVRQHTGQLALIEAPQQPIGDRDDRLAAASGREGKECCRRDVVEARDMLECGAARERFEQPIDEWRLGRREVAAAVERHHQSRRGLGAE